MHAATAQKLLRNSLKNMTKTAKSWRAELYLGGDSRKTFVSGFNGDVYRDKTDKVLQLYCLEQLDKQYVRCDIDKGEKCKRIKEDETQ